jgi:hypothetical protein
VKVTAAGAVAVKNCKTGRKEGAGASDALRSRFGFPISLGSHAQGALEFDWKRELLEETGWVQIVLTRFVDHTDEIVRRCICVVHDRIQLSDLE